jgi:hypothetical protein
VRPQNRHQIIDRPRLQDDLLPDHRVEQGDLLLMLLPKEGPSVKSAADFVKREPCCDSVTAGGHYWIN